MHRSQQREKIVWSARTSSLLYAGQYLLGALFAALLMPADLRIGIIPLAVCTWYWLSARAMRYELTQTRLIFYSGIFSTQIEELSLKDIRDFDILQPRFFKLFSLGTVLLIVDETSDEQPCVICVPDPDRLVHRIRRLSQDGKT